MTRFSVVGEQRSQTLLMMSGDTQRVALPPISLSLYAPDAISAALSLCAPMLSALENPQIYENTIVKLQTWAENKCLIKS